jgi:predicted PhzF superfamily epimerase YddE/YHI9
VPFCGDATIATAVALAERDGAGDIVFHIAAGTVPVRTSADAAGAISASLEREHVFHARNPFPVGGVVEDPATGAAAAAFGAYLRDRGLVKPPTTVTILQGDDMGRPSRLTVGIVPDRPEISVSGRAVRIRG